MLYQKNALQHFSFAESPLSKEEKKEVTKDNGES